MPPRPILEASTSTLIMYDTLVKVYHYYYRSTTYTPSPSTMSNVQQYLLAVNGDKEKALSIAQDTARGILASALYPAIAHVPRA